MTDPPHPPSPKLTSAITAFLDELRTGDVLLFNSLHPVSHAIKLVDNSPVNHCALYRGHKSNTIVHANMPSTKGEPAVREESLRGRLCEGLDRTATALRSPQVGTGRRVMKMADYWLSNPTAYGFKSLPRLASMCIHRAYSGRVSKTRIAALHRTAQLMNAALDIAFPNDKGKISVTCSEFVYSCYIGASKSIEIRHPLSVLPNGKPVKSYYANPRVPGPGRYGPRTERPATTVPGMVFPGPGGGLIAVPGARRRGVGFDARLNNERLELDHDVRDDFRSRGAEMLFADQKLPPFAQAVTPFDLWQSPSFTVVKVLHLPPGAAGDKVWEGTVDRPRAPSAGRRRGPGTK